MTETRFYEPARLSTPNKPLFSLKPLDATTWLRSLLSKVFSLFMGDETRHVNHTESVYVTKSLWTAVWVRLCPKISQINKKLWDEVCGYSILSTDCLTNSRCKGKENTFFSIILKGARSRRQLFSWYENFMFTLVVVVVCPPIFALIDVLFCDIDD